MSSDCSEPGGCLKEDSLSINLNSHSLMETLEQNEDGISYQVIQVEPKVEPSGENGSLSPILQSPSEFSDTQKATLMSDPLDGEFYVINPGPQLFTTVSCIPVANNSKQKHSNAMKIQDNKKKESHKEVERRRRDKINNWILKLGEMIPPDEDVQEKPTDSLLRSKSLILARACNYIGELRSANESLGKYAKANEHLVSKVEKVKAQNAELQYENSILKSMLEENGLLIDPSNARTDEDSNPS